MVSSSSWTEDEDFHILIDAFESKFFLFLNIKNKLEIII
jgi:hypothetical protein